MLPYTTFTTTLYYKAISLGSLTGMGCGGVIEGVLGGVAVGDVPL